MNKLLLKPRIYVALATVLSLLLVQSPAEALVAGAWQHPITPWVVDGYAFAEYAGGSGYHLADDVGGPPGTPVYAVANSVIKEVDNWPAPGNYGGLILAEQQNQDGSANVALYGHLDGDIIQVSEGQEVQRGELIGYLGDSTKNGGWPPHIHFGIHKNAYTASPWDYPGYGPQSAITRWENPSTYIEDHTKVVEVTRVPSQSADRYATAEGVSLRRYPTAGSATNIFLASGQSYVDALATTPFTKTGNGPLLLTKKDELPASTLAEIKRVLAPGGTVRILGGEAVIAAGVQKTLTDAGFAIERIAGARREETAVLLADRLPDANAAFLVSADSFADAVSAAGPATQLGLPLLLTKPGSVGELTKNFLASRPNIKTIHIVGGYQAISSDVEYQLWALPSIKGMTRTAGLDRYETNAKLSQTFIPAPKRLIFATGTDYPDALAGGSLVASEQGQLLLSKPDMLPDTTKALVESVRPNIDQALVLGGTAAIANAFDSNLASLLNAPLTTASDPVTSQAESHTGTTSIALSSWQSASTQTIAGLNLPIPAGAQISHLPFRGAQVELIGSTDLSGELPPELVVSTIPLQGSAEQTLEQWFGQDISLGASDAQGLTQLGYIRGFVPALTAYLERNNELVVIESRLPQDLTAQIFAGAVIH